jgi:hypothetical protein
MSEACATNIEDLGVQRGHRTLHFVGKGNKPATIPLVPRSARTLDLAIGETTYRSPPDMPTRERRPSTTSTRELDRHAAYVVVALVAGG